MTHEIVLSGCTPVPLANYLKGLGVLRLVAEQVDSDARGCWQNDQFVLITRLNEKELERFFLEEYRPTPVLAPWNGGSGFYPQDNQSGIDPIAKSQSSRFELYCESIHTIKAVLEKYQLQKKPEGEDKKRLLSVLRGELNEAALAWLDSAVLLSEDNPKYPPLLGTGGNDGRLDFTNNFMQRLVGVIDTDSGTPKSSAAMYLSEALFSRSIPGLLSKPIGQFSPGSAGGANQGSGFSSGALINPWNFILMLEGALLFAVSSTRRLESHNTVALSYPFTVRATGAGSGSSSLGDEGNAREEIWVPLWSTSTSLTELQSLLTEGRVTIGRRPVNDGLDFIRAVSKLGIDRGITGFQRYAFMMRSGKAYFATPLNRITVIRNPTADLIDELDNNYWLSRLRRLGRGANATQRIESLVRRLEDAVFNLAQERDYPGLRVQRVLELLGEIQVYLAHSPNARELCPPVPSLSQEWFVKANDNSSEFEIAAALAGLHGRRAGPEGKTQYLLPMRCHLAPETDSRYPEWLQESGHHVTLGQGRIEDNLIATLQRRLLLAHQLELADKPLYSARNASLSSVAEWLEGNLNEPRVAGLFPGLTLVRIPPGEGAKQDERMGALPGAYRILKPFFCTDKQLHDAGIIETERSLPIKGEFIRRLTAGDVSGTVALAARNLRIAGVPINYPELRTSIADSRRLLAALMVPITHYDLKSLFLRRTHSIRQPEMTD